MLLNAATRHCQLCLLQQTRKLLSPAYEAAKLTEEAWEQRRENSVLQPGSKNPYEALTDVQKKYLGGGIASAVDVDIMANCLRWKDQLPELKDIIYKFRHTRQACHALDSMSHAVLRLCLEHEDFHLVETFLSDPINYGIFPDNFTANLILNRLIERDGLAGATKLAAFLMQQEMFDNQLTCYLSVYACLKWLEKGGTADYRWEYEVKEEEQSSSRKSYMDEEDEIVMKVPYLKNPWFDDHFDLHQPLHLVGKTLAWMCAYLPQNEFSLTAQFLGWMLYEKPEECHSMVSKGLRVDRDTIELARKYLTSEEKTSDEAKEKSESNQSENVSKCLNLLDSMVENNQTKESRNALSSQLETLLAAELPRLQADDVESMKQIYRRWEEQREKLLHSQVETFLKGERLRKIAEERAALAEEEEKVLFFENQTTWEKLAQPEPHEGPKKKPLPMPKRAKGRIFEKAKTQKQIEAELPSDEEYMKMNLQERRREVDKFDDDIFARK